MSIALTGARVFDGSRIVDGPRVVVDGGRIAGRGAGWRRSAGAAVRRVEGLLAPGFIDVQVNGGGGVLFNDARTVEGIAAIGAAHRRFGTTGFLPTLITDTREHMAEAIAATAARRLPHSVPGVLGIHLEGPFLNPERKGVHDPRCSCGRSTRGHRAGHLARARPDADDARAGEGAGGDRSPGWPRRA